jgi:hypothetical protein
MGARQGNNNFVEDEVVSKELRTLRIFDLQRNMNRRLMKDKKIPCAYCAELAPRRELTKEHFVPQCLWSGSRPNRTLTALVHARCNAAKSDDDEFFRNALIAIRGTENHPEARQVVDGAIKSDLLKRPQKLLNHLKNLRLSSVETRSGIYLGEHFSFSLDIPRFFKVVEKIVRGLYFCKLRKPVAKDHTVAVLWDNPNTQAMMSPLFPHLKPTASFGDDTFIYNWIVDPRDDRKSYWLLGFYKAVSLYAATLSSEPHPMDSTQAHLNIPVIRL